jgi:pimeloyl-ACP methyl ester carboxylesterase
VGKHQPLQKRGSSIIVEEVFKMADRINDIVLVHGGFVDGSGWAGVYNILEKDGFNVSVVQNPTISLEGDVAATKTILDQQPGDVILVGHSYGGAVITEAGTHKKVAGLVYITAFAPDAGESVNTLIANPPPGAPVPPILPPIDGYLFLDKQKFAASFAGDVDAATAKFMADSQVPWGVNALAGAITAPAWKSKPSWYLLVTDDRMIPLPAQQLMCKRAGATSMEVPGSHAIYVSHPSAVAALIKTAATSPKFASG